MSKLKGHEDEVVQRYLAGETVINLAKEYDVSREAIYQHLRKRQGWDEGAMQERFHTNKIDSDIGWLIDEIAVLTADDSRITVKEIADMLDIKPKEVQRALRYMRKRGWKRNAERDEKIRTRYLRGWTQDQIARDVNLTQARVNAILKRELGDNPEQMKGRLAV